MTDEIREMIDAMKEEGATSSQVGVVLDSIDELTVGQKYEILKEFLPPDKTEPVPPPIATLSAERTAEAPRAAFWAYCVQNFATTRWLESIGICLGLVVIPFVSLMKPVLGFRGLCFVLAGATGLSVVSGMAYLFWCFIAYHKGASSNRASSVIASVAYGCLMFLIPVAPWIAAEYFTPTHGVLATIVPGFQKYQARWFALPGDNQLPAQSNDVPESEKPRLTQNMTRFVYTGANGRPGQFTSLGGKRWVEGYGGGARSDFTEVERGNQLVELFDKERNVTVHIFSDRYEFKVGPRGKWERGNSGEWKMEK